MKKTGGAAIAASFMSSAPMFVPQQVMGANDRIVMGIIGLGWRGTDHLHTFFRKKEVQIAAVCDLDMPFLLHGLKFLDDQQTIDRKWVDGGGGEMRPAKITSPAAAPYLDYRQLLERKDIDAVSVAVPDHWHAKIYIDAMDAGKDVYGEKPLSLTIKQGRAIVDAVKRNSRVFQTGSQQRSSSEFRQACEYVQSGRIGKIKEVRVGVGGAPQTQAVPNELVPPGLNWDMWMGATKEYPYNPLRCHVTFRWFFDYSGGMVTDWGAHHLDIAQWGLGMDGKGPRFVEGTAETSPGFYTTFTNFDMKFTYGDGTPLYFGSKIKHGITFVGEKGEIWVQRGDTKSTPESIYQEPLKDSDVHLYKSDDHFQNFLDCVKSRETPITPAEVGHRSVTLCHLTNICGWVGEKLEWDYEKETFVGSNAAKGNQHLDRDPREPWSYL